MLVRTETARAAVQAAAVTADQPGVGDADRVGRRGGPAGGRGGVANAKTGIQVHGGMGFTWEVPGAPLPDAGPGARLVASAPLDDAGPDRRRAGTEPRRRHVMDGRRRQSSPRATPCTACSCPCSPSRPCTRPSGRPGPGPAEIEQVARAADDAGFFYVGVCDHTAIPERLAGAMGTVWYDTTATLGWLAGLTSRVRLLSHVLVLAQRHPLRAAKELSTLDLLSGGRLIVGVGAGHVPEEYELLTGGFERARAGHRRGGHRAGHRLHRGVPRAARPPLAGVGHGRRPPAGAAPAAAHLDRRIQPAGHPAGRRPGRRLAAPGHAGAGTCPARSPSSAGCGRSSGTAPRSTWAPSPNRST